MIETAEPVALIEAPTAKRARPTTSSSKCRARARASSPARLAPWTRVSRAARRRCCVITRLPTRDLIFVPFGLLFQAARSRTLTKAELRVCVDDLVGKYDFRISIDLYQRMITEIESV